MGSFYNQQNYDYEKVITEKTVEKTTKTISGVPINQPEPCNPKQSKPLSRRTKIQILVIISVLSNGIAIFVTISFAVCMLKKTQQAYLDTKLCLPCSILKQHQKRSTNPEIVHTESTNGGSLCCFSNQSKTEAQSLVELVSMTTKRDTTDNSLHVYYSEEATESQGETGQPIKLKQWTKTGERVHIGEGIHCDEETGDFTISVAGNYMIYSHMAFQLPAHELYMKKNQGHNLTFLFDHRLSVLYERQQTVDTVVMKESAEAVCTLKDSYGGKLYPCHISNLVGMLPLNEGERVSVEVSPLKYLLGELKSSYFGLFLVD